jgi:hypothetical protein
METWAAGIRVSSSARDSEQLYIERARRVVCSGADGGRLGTSRELDDRHLVLVSPAGLKFRRLELECIAFSFRAVASCRQTRNRTRS